MKFIALLVVVGLIGGYLYYTHHKKEVSAGVDAVVSTTNISIDATVETAMKGVAKASPIYYFNARNYGVSDTQNICFDSVSKNSLAEIIAGIQKYTKAVNCTADADYPSRSFTITAPSRANPGQYFCTDQSGYAGLIPSIEPGSGFRLAIRCKK